MNFQEVIKAVTAWPVEDRLRLIEEVRDTISDETWEMLSEATPLTEAHKHDLRRRLDAYRDNPKAGSPWEEVQGRLRGNGR